MKVRRVVDLAYERDLEASLFAMNLMMPEEFVRREVPWFAANGFDIVDDPAIKKLAEKFVVTEQLMLLRLVQLGYFADIMSAQALDRRRLYE